MLIRTFQTQRLLKIAAVNALQCLVRYLILIIGSVCLCHGEHASYFLAPYDKRKHTGHAHQQVASQASTDSAWKHPVWLPQSSLGFQRPVRRRSNHNKFACAALLTLTPQATITRSAIVACVLVILFSFLLVIVYLSFITYYTC